MDAGPELDALVAEKVMGWVLHQPSDRAFPTEWLEIATGVRYVVGLVDGWSPSTDWLAAGEVWDKLCAEYGSARLAFWRGVFTAQVFNFEECEARTGPHAMMLAALAAVEEKEPCDKQS